MDYETEINTLKNEVLRLNECLTNNKMKANMRVFKCDEFLKSAYPDEYLESCDINHNVLDKVMNNIKKLDLSCMRYIIDMYACGKYDWDEEFYDNEQNN